VRVTADAESDPCVGHVYYRLTKANAMSEVADQRLGALQWYDITKEKQRPADDQKLPDQQCMPLASIKEVVLGTRMFTDDGKSDVALANTSDRCFTLLSANKVRWHLEAKEQKAVKAWATALVAVLTGAGLNCDLQIK